MLETSTTATHLDDAGRKRLGAYYTPAPLVQLLIDSALPETRGREAASGERPAVCDPACGSGHFLIAAARRIAGERANAERKLDVLRNYIFGLDIDPIAVSACRRRLAEWAGAAPRELETNIRVADALDGDWPLPRSRFDLIVGNPPFANAIEEMFGASRKQKLRGLFPSLGGTADLSHYFFARSAAQIAPGGRIAMILPRSVLGAPACASLRQSLPLANLHPTLIYCPERCDLFADAAVFICGLILGPSAGACRVSHSLDLDYATWQERPIRSGNWWTDACGSSRTHDEDTTTISEAFHIAASMTAGEAYEAQSLLVDDEHALGSKLVTTGLIDPDRCWWGTKPCRYLGRRMTFPRIVERESVELNVAWRRRLNGARRPKVLVAGLTRKIECFLDARGEYIGAVSTFSIFHPADDLAALARLGEHLSSAEMTERFVAALGASGMRGGHITMTKAFLRSLPMSQHP